MISRAEIKPGDVILMPDDYIPHSFSNVGAGWIVVIYYTCEHLCSGMNVRKNGIGMDIDWGDIEHGRIINHIDEPEEDFYHWVAEGRTSSSFDSASSVAKTREYREKFFELLEENFPEYAL